MSGTAFVWSIAAGMAATALCALIPALAAAIVKRRAARFKPYPEAERLEEEWAAAIQELPSRIDKAKFAIELLLDRSLKIQIEADNENRPEIELIVQIRLEEERERARLANEPMFHQLRAQLEKVLANNSKVSNFIDALAQRIEGMADTPEEISKLMLGWAQ